MTTAKSASVEDSFICIEKRGKHVRQHVLRQDRGRITGLPESAKHGNAKLITKPLVHHILQRLALAKPLVLRKEKPHCLVEPVMGMVGGMG